MCGWGVANISETLTREFQELSGFMQQYFQLMLIDNRVRQTGRSLIILLEQIELMGEMHLLSGKVANISETLERKFQELCGFYATIFSVDDNR